MTTDAPRMQQQARGGLAMRTHGEFDLDRVKRVYTCKHGSATKHGRRLLIVAGYATALSLSGSSAAVCVFQKGVIQ